MIRIVMADDHAIADNIRLEATPGHTPHHVALRVGGGDHEALFTGDLIHSPLQARYPELSMRADWDPTLAAKTRRRVLGGDGPLLHLLEQLLEALGIH